MIFFSRKILFLRLAAVLCFHILFSVKAYSQGAGPGWMMHNSINGPMCVEGPMALMWDDEVSLGVEKLKDGIAIKWTTKNATKVKDLHEMGDHLKELKSQVSKDKNGIKSGFRDHMNLRGTRRQGKWGMMQGMRHGFMMGWYGDPIPSTPASIKKGKALYEESCQSCHGKEGRGDGPEAKGLAVVPADLASLTKRFPKHHFYMQIAYGRGEMPAWKDTYSTEDIWHLTNYIRAFSK
ncbi:MAG: cytochrome c [Bdellovibrionota bacterium]